MLQEEVKTVLPMIETSVDVLLIQWFDVSEINMSVVYTIRSKSFKMSSAGLH